MCAGGSGTSIDCSGRSWSHLSRSLPGLPRSSFSCVGTGRGPDFISLSPTDLSLTRLTSPTAFGQIAAQIADQNPLRDLAIIEVAREFGLKTATWRPGNLLASRFFNP